MTIGKTPSRNKGRQDRRNHISTLHSLEAMLEERAQRYRDSDALTHPLGGSITHLSPADYMAQKIANAIEQIQGR